jgi:hypothetical protein
MSINYNKIKDLVSLLYKYVYEHDNTILSNYNYEKPDWTNIKIDNLIGKNFDYQTILNSNYDSKENFKIMNIIGDNKCKKIIIKKYFKEFPLTIIIQKYLSNNEPININDITYELFINQIISEFAVQDNIPFFLLNICNFNLTLSKISNYPEFHNLLTKEYNLLDSNDSESIFCFSIYEHYHSYITFKELLQDELTTDDIKMILFQLFYIYAYLITKLDSFYHGEYTIDSFLIIKNTDNSKKNIKLSLGDTFFELKNVKYICKLFNYRKSQIGGFKNYSEKDIVINNPTYAMYTILKSLYSIASYSNKKNFDKIKIAISNFIPNDILEKNTLDENNFYNTYTDTIIPAQILLKNNFFGIFINMNFKYNTSKKSNEKNNIENKKNIDILNMKSMKSDTIESEMEGTIGYRKINSNVLEGGAKKPSKKSSKKSKSTKTKSKTNKSSKLKKYKKQSRQEVLSSSDGDSEDKNEYEDVDNVDSYTDDAEETEKLELETETENEISDEPVKKNDNISIQEEEENITLNTEGDDDNDKVPLDSEEMGANYKKIIKNLMRENKKLKNKQSKSSKTSKSKSKSKSSKDDSSSFNLDLDDLDGNENGKLFQNPNQNQNQNQMEGTNGLGGLGGIGSIPNISNLMGTNQNMSNAMLPDPSFSSFANNGVAKMKQGTNNNFNQIFSNIKEGQMIQVLPEMQGLFDYNQIINMPHKEFSSEVGGDMGGFMNNGGPKIMDQGLLNQNMGMGMGGMGMGGMGMGGMGMGGMKKQLPLISDPNLASMAGINQYGNLMNNSLGSAISGEFGTGSTNDSVPTNNSGSGDGDNKQSALSNQNILEGGFGFDANNSKNLAPYRNVVKLRQGTMKGFDLNNIHGGGIIEVPPEMQHYFDFEKLVQEQAKQNQNNLQENEKKKKFFFLTKK